jgi:hypothetical protein
MSLPQAIVPIPMNGSSYSQGSGHPIFHLFDLSGDPRLSIYCRSSLTRVVYFCLILTSNALIWRDLHLTNRLGSFGKLLAFHRTAEYQKCKDS